jgi:hypothetical protein
MAFEPDIIDVDYGPVRAGQNRCHGRMAGVAGEH